MDILVLALTGILVILLFFIKNPYLHSVANEFIISCKNSLQGERI